MGPPAVDSGESARPDLKNVGLQILQQFMSTLSPLEVISTAVQLTHCESDQLWYGFLPRGRNSLHEGHNMAAEREVTKKGNEKVKLEPMWLRILCMWLCQYNRDMVCRI